MNLLERYPTVSMLLTFFISSCFLAYCSPIVKIIVASAALIALVVLLIISRFRQFAGLTKDLKYAVTLMLCAIMLSSAISFVSFNVYSEKIEKNAGGTDHVTVVIEECRFTYSYSSGYVVKVKDSDLIPKGTKLLLTTDDGYLPDGTMLSGEVIYSSLSDLNIGTFDSKRYYNSKKIMLEAEDVSLESVGIDSRFSPTRVMRNINKRLTALIMAHSDRKSGGLAAAVFLGNDEHLADSTVRDFRRIGISHLLVVSGSHFSVLLATADSLWKRLRLRRRTRSAFNIALIFLFMGLTGFTATVIRAGIMHLIAQLSLLLFKKANVLNSLAVSGTLLVLINPFSVLDVGMQLSFVAAYCCITFQMMKGRMLTPFKKHIDPTKVGYKLRKIIVSAVEIVLLTTLINLCTLPLTWLYFGEVSALAVLSNIVFIPLITVLMHVVIIYLILYPLAVFTPLLAYVINVFGGLLGFVAEKIASINGAVISINYSFAVYFIVPICVLLILLPLIKGKWRIVSIFASVTLAFALVISIGAINYAERDNIHLTYMNSGKNDGFVIKSESKALICDISDGSFTFARKLTGEVSLLHLSEVDSLLLTHYHNKHIQLVSRISENEILRTVILPEPIDHRERDIYNSICKLAGDSGLEIITIPEGGSFYFGDAVITIFPREYLSRSTHPITAVKIQMRDEDAVILSGSFNEAASDLMTVAEWADYLIFGAHSPVYKKSFGLDFSSDPKEIVLSDSVYEFMDDGLREYVDSRETHRCPAVFRVTVKGNS